MSPETGPSSAGATLAQDIETVSLLDDPVRRRVYFSVPLQPAFADRDQVAADLGIRRNLAAFHLDKLAEAGLLEVSYRRTGGKTGRGAGRPRKLYQRKTQEVSVSLPARNYPLVAELLATAIESSGRPAQSKLAIAARRRGSEVGKATLSAAGKKPSRAKRLAALLDTLVRYGYEPYIEGGAVYMRNCPFHALKRDHREITCVANEALMTGIVETMDPADYVADYEPDENRCCVVLRAAAAGRRT